MNVELLKAVIGLIQQGGWFALGGIALWGIMQLIKVCLVVFLIKAIATLVYKGYSNTLSLKLLHKDKAVSLLSEEVSEKLYKDLETFQQSTGQAMKDFLKESGDLLADLKSTQKPSKKK